MSLQAHWDEVYRSKSDAQMSWFQMEPRISLELIRSAAPDLGSRIVDVGGGSSALVKRLLEMGYRAITVVDLSRAALERSKVALGERAGELRWVCADITEGPELGEVDVWHDRAAFHFLVEEGPRQRYRGLAERTIRVGGTLIVGGFALDGPVSCSGLRVRRSDAAGLAEEFGPAFVLRRSVREVHTTPWGKAQPFEFAVLERVADV
jgi:SAM-dependent methyltransferase